MTIFHDILVDMALYLPVLLVCCGLSSYFLGWKRTFIMVPFAIAAFLAERIFEEITFPMILYALALTAILWVLWIKVFRFPAEEYEGSWTFTDDEGTAHITITSSKDCFVLTHDFDLSEGEDNAEYELRKHWRRLRLQAKDDKEVLLEFSRKGELLKVTKPGMNDWEMVFRRQEASEAPV